MTGQRSRRKGAEYERVLVKRFREAMPGGDVQRGFQYRSGAEVPDVDAAPFWVESKRGRKPNIRAALKQVIAVAPPGRIPIAVIRDDRAAAHVTLTLEDFLDLVSEWWARRSK